MRRGQLWARGDHEAFVIVAADRYGMARLPTTWAIPLTPHPPTTVGPPFVVHLPTSATGLRAPVWARVAAGVASLPVNELDRRIGQLDPAALAEIDVALRELLDLPGASSA